MSDTLDEIDLQIMDALQEDARIPYIRLAQDLGVADTTIKARVNRLIRRFGVRFIVDIDPKELGLGYAYLGLQVQGPALTRAVERISDVPEVIFLGRTVGGYDLLVELVSRSNDDLLRILDEIRAVPGVTAVDTFTVLRVEKENWQFSNLANVGGLTTA